MFKLLKGYLIKNKGKLLILISAVALSVMIVFANAVSKQSQTKFTIDTIYEKSPSFQAYIDNMSLDSFEKVKHNDNIKRYILVKNFGFMTYKNQTCLLEEYNHQYFDAYKANIIEGSEPRNSNEIIVNKDFIDYEIKKDNSKKISDFIGTEIPVRITKKYKDKDNSMQILDEKRNFKIVGVYNTPEIMRSFNTFYSALVYKDFKIAEEATTYNGSIDLKTEFKKSIQKVEELSYDLDETRECIAVNESLTDALEDNHAASNEYDDFDKATIITCAFLIFNVFNIMLKSMIQELGIIRIVGMSKKRAFLFLIIKNFIILITGSIIGLILGYFLSGILIKHFILTITSIDATIAPIYISKKTLLRTLSTVTITVTISTIIPILATIRKSPIEMINLTFHSGHNKLSRFFKLGKHNRKSNHNSKNISTNLAINNTKKNIFFVISTAIIVGIIGQSIICRIFIAGDDKDLEYSPSILELNGYDIDLSYNKISDSPNVGFKNTDVEKISNIDGVKDIYAVNKDEGFLNLKGSDLTDFYRKMNFIKNNEKTSDIRVDILTIKQKDLKNYKKDHKNFLEKGAILTPNSDIPEVLVYNKFYDKFNSSDKQSFLSELKVNDIINVKVKTETNNHIEYKVVKAKVAGLLGEEWDNLSDTEHFVPDIVFNPDDYQKLTGVSTFTQIKVMTSSGKEELVRSKVKNLFNDKHIYDYSDKQTKIDDICLLRKQFIIQQLMKSFLLMVTAIVNITFCIVTSIVVRKREFAMLRSIGLPLSGLKKILLKEGFIFGIISCVIGYIIILSDALFLHYLNVYSAKMLDVPYNESWYNIPTIPMLIFIISTILICTLSATLTFKKLDRLNIIEEVKSE